MEYLLHVLILAIIYALLSLSLDLIAGQIGLLSVAQGAFFGIGAYTSALMASRNDGEMFSCLIAGMLGNL
jgi:branched-chain amino acid transport system permease protein